MTTDVALRFLVYGAEDVRRTVGYVSSDLTKLEKDITRMTGGVDKFGQAFSRAGDFMLGISRSMVLITAPLVALEASLISAGIAFEDGFAAIAKTTDGVTTSFKDAVLATPELYDQIVKIQNEVNKLGTGAQKITVDDAFNIWLSQVSSYGFDNVYALFDKMEASGGFNVLTEDGKELRDGFRELALEMPIAMGELLKIGEMAGQIGIPEEAILGFTKIVAQLALSTDLGPEAAAETLGRFAAIFGVAEADIEDWSRSFGSALTALGNTSNSTESDIVAMTNRMATFGPLLGMTEAEVMALATSISEVGVAPERGGTAVQKMLMEMMDALATGGEKLDLFGNIAGVTGEEFAELFKGDPLTALKLFTEGFAELNDENQVTKDLLNELGLGGLRVQEAAKLLGISTEALEENLVTANMAWDQQIALEEEYRKRAATTKSMIQLVKNAFTELGITLFDLYEQDIKKLVNGFKDLILYLKDLDPKILKTAVTITGIAAAIVPLTFVLGTLLKSFGMVFQVIGGISAIFTSGLIVPLAAVALAVGALYIAWDQNFLGMHDATDSLASTLKNSGITDFFQDLLRLVSTGDFVGAVVRIEEGINKLSESIKGITNADVMNLGIVQTVIEQISLIKPGSFLLLVGGLIALAAPSVVGGITNLTMLAIFATPAIARGIASIALSLRAAWLSAAPLLFLFGLIVAYQTDLGGVATSVDNLGNAMREFGDDPSIGKSVEISRQFRDVIWAIPGGLADWAVEQTKLFEVLGADWTVPEGLNAWKDSFDMLKIIAVELFHNLVVLGAFMAAIFPSLISGSVDWLFNPDHEGGLVNGIISAGDWLVNPDREGGLVNSINKLPGKFTELFNSLNLPLHLNGSIEIPIQDTATSVINAVTKLVTDIVNLFTVTLPNGLSSLGASLVSKLEGPFNSALNGIIRSINGVIKGINELLSFTGGVRIGYISEVGTSAPAASGGSWINDFNPAASLAQDQKADGGIARKGVPTLFGERGPELGIPITDTMIFPANITKRIMQSMLSFTNPAQYTTNQNTYNPVFNAPPTQETMRANTSMFENWMLATQG